MKRTMRGSKGGFTLIELLLVVAVIGVLAAIALPVFSSYRTRAYNSTASADLKNLRSELEAHYAEYSRYP